MAFLNREDAGRRLARMLSDHRGRDTLVIGLPRGGVVVAYEVARVLGAPLDVWMVRKIGAPFQPELGIGAIAEGGGLFLDPRMARMVGATDEEIAAVVRREVKELERRLRVFRGDRPRPEVKDKTVLLVDDGIATGSTVRAAVRAIKEQGPPKQLVLAVPVGATESLDLLSEEVDEVVCVHATDDLIAVGAWYQNFEQTTDDEVVALLEVNRQEQSDEPSTWR
jgi:putative phosphoribosyl transferase